MPPFLPVWGRKWGQFLRGECPPLVSGEEAGRSRGEGRRQSCHSDMKILLFVKEKYWPCVCYWNCVSSQRSFFLHVPSHLSRRESPVTKTRDHSSPRGGDTLPRRSPLNSQLCKPVRATEPLRALIFYISCMGRITTTFIGSWWRFQQDNICKDTCKGLWGLDNNSAICIGRMILPLPCQRVAVTGVVCLWHECDSSPMTATWVREAGTLVISRLYVSLWIELERWLI